MKYLEALKSKRYTNCNISFSKNGEKIKFESGSARDLFNKVIDWLFSTGYKFEGDFHSKKNQTRCLFNTNEVEDKINKTTYAKKDFHNIPGSDYWIMCATPIKQMYNELFKMLSLHGVDNNSIKTEGLDIIETDRITKASEFVKQAIDSKTWLNATIDYLKSIDNEPQTVEEIWDAISGYVKTAGKTPLDSLRVMMTHHYPTNFETIEGRPRKYKLSELNNEIIGDEEVEKIKTYSKNPFRQSICVLGESGAGKSTTLEHILEFEGHEFEFIIPSASTTGLLSQFSPSRSGYIPSRLGKMIVEAFNNPTTLYTAVFDECHKSNVIEMINDELLQAISTKRNMGKRFISLDEDTSELYKGVDTFRGNILIPDNFGFIFISSKPRIIANNTDFFNRVELVLLTEYDRDMSTSDELLSKVLPEE